jgi:pSer/pThr/pTyr-binding forkhead associated (FHA) protein
METQLIQHAADLEPSLEHYPEDGGPSVKTALDAFPFSIGREDSNELQVNSGRVSRRHAVIVREGDAFRVEDLGSTNGTLLNGLRITEARLRSGDILAFGDVEFTFNAGRAAPQRMVTQVMTCWRDARGQDELRRTIYEVRRLHERFLHRCTPIVFEPILCLEDGSLFGYEAKEVGASPLGRGASAAERRLTGVDCRLVTRLRQMGRLVAAEDAARIPGQLTLVFSVEPAEIGRADLADSIGGLGEIAGRDKRLVFAVPRDAVSDNECFRRFCGRLQGCGMGMAHDRFQGGELPAGDSNPMGPGLLRLAPSLMRGAHQVAQRREAVEAAVRQACSAGWQVIATAILNEEEAAWCRQLGCEYGQGELWGDPEPAWSLAARRTSREGTRDADAGIAAHDGAAGAEAPSNSVNGSDLRRRQPVSIRRNPSS